MSKQRHLDMSNKHIIYFERLSKVYKTMSGDHIFCSTLLETNIAPENRPPQ